MDIVESGQSSREEARSFLYEPVDDEQYFGVAERNIHNYEGFAFWMEDLLSRVTGTRDTFKARRREVPYPDEGKELLQYFREVEEGLTRFGLIAQMGFPKYYDGEDVKDVLKNVYGSRFEDIDIGILYGSQKPESDIDVFVVTEEDYGCYFNGWLDVFGVPREEFEEGLKHFDIALTDPLFTGKLICGDEQYYQRTRREVKQSSITRKNVEYNLRRAEENREAAGKPGNTERQTRSALSYSETYRKNAQALKGGKKPLTESRVKEITD